MAQRTSGTRGGGSRAGPETALSAAMRRARGVLVLVALFSAVVNLLLLASPLYMMQVFDRVLASGSRETLLYLTLIIAVAFLALGVMDALRLRVLSSLGAWLEDRVGPDLLAATVDRGLRGQGHGGGQAQRDLMTLRTFFGGQGIQPLFDGPWLPLFLVCIWLLHPWIGALATGCAVILLILAALNELTTRGAQQAGTTAAAAAHREADAANRNADIVHALGLLPVMTRRWRTINQKAIGEAERASRRGAVLVGISRFIRLFAQSAVLGLGAYLVLARELTPGGMIAGSILLGRALAPVEQAITAWKQVLAARISYRRLQGVLAGGPDDRTPQPLPPLRGHIEISRAIVFAPGVLPGQGAPILRGVNLEIQPGEVVGVIGPSGSGKTTLCRLLVGAWPPRHGSVRLDDADVDHWHRSVIGPQIGYLPQDVELFAGSVRANIARLGEPDDAAVLAAAQAADVHEMILSLPQGYETDIGEGGAVLSAGQRQRVGLARALYGEPRLLIFDEPNANLDTEGEAALVRAIAAAKARGATIVLVTHRPNVVSQADKLLVLRGGQVEAFDTRERVLAQLRGPRMVKPGPADTASGGVDIRDMASSA